MIYDRIAGYYAKCLIFCTEQTDTGIEAGYQDFDETNKLKSIVFNEVDFHCPENAESLTKDTLNTIRLMKQLQQANGEKTCQRFIISNCQQASDILQLIDLFLWSGWKKDTLSVDFVPLFEMVNDLEARGRS